VFSIPSLFRICLSQDLSQQLGHGRLPQGAEQIEDLGILGMKQQNFACWEHARAAALCRNSARPCAAKRLLLIAAAGVTFKMRCWACSASNVIHTAPRAAGCYDLGFQPSAQIQQLSTSNSLLALVSKDLSFFSTFRPCPA